MFTQEEYKQLEIDSLMLLDSIPQLDDLHIVFKNYQLMLARLKSLQREKDLLMQIIETVSPVTANLIKQTESPIVKKIEEFKDLLGETLTDVKNTGAEIIFTLRNGNRYHLYHEQDCCESVYVEDVIGDLNDLVGSPLLMVEEISNAPDPEGIEKDPSYHDSHTWTFYKMATIKGYVTIRFLGESNGFYSESVDFKAI